MTIALQVEDADYITREHIGIILTCVQELNAEIDKVVPLSKEFREKINQLAKEAGYRSASSYLNDYFKKL